MSNFNFSSLTILPIKFEGDFYDYIYDAFNLHAEKKLGIKNYWGDEIAYAAYDDEKKFLGFITYALCGGQLWINQLFVEEKARGKGVGSKLINIAFEYAKENGSDFVYLETMSFQGVEFYFKHGFVEDWRRDGFLGDAAWLYLSKKIK